MVWLRLRPFGCPKVGPAARCFNVPSLETVRSHAQKRVERGYVSLYRAFRQAKEGPQADA